MKGLLPNLRQFTVLQNPTTFQELQCLASQTQDTVVTSLKQDPTSQVLKTLQEVQAQLNSLSMDRADLKGSMDSTVNAAMVKQQFRTSSPQSSKEHFQSHVRDHYLQRCSIPHRVQPRIMAG